MQSPTPLPHMMVRQALPTCALGNITPFSDYSHKRAFYCSLWVTPLGLPQPQPPVYTLVSSKISFSR